MLAQFCLKPLMKSKAVDLSDQFNYFGSLIGVDGLVHDKISA